MIIDEFQAPGKMFQVLNENGEIVNSSYEPKLSDDELKQFYEWMLISRRADDKAVSLQRQGRMGTYAEVKGQEAAQIGSSYALRDNDWMVPAFRELTAFLVRGIPIEYVFAYWMGNENGNTFEQKTTFPVSIPVGSQTTYAMGLAWASKIKKEDQVTLVYFGDGGSSEGDFHDSLNFAGVFKAPIVFVCQNNQYAISVPRSKQTAAETIAQRANGYGFKGILVDGNDVLAMYAATKEAVENAQKGIPTLIEAFTYRLGAHTTSDDPKKYRKDKELEEWKLKDPIIRLQKYLQSKKLWNEDYEKELQEKVETIVSEATKKAEAMPLPSIEDLFNYTYQDMNDNLKEQLEDMKKWK